MTANQQILTRRSGALLSLALMLFAHAASADTIGVPQGTLPVIDSGENEAVTSSPDTFTGPLVNNIVGANRFYTNGITGQNAIVANVEAGHIWNGHETLTHVTNFVHHADAFGTTTADLYDRHATWVGMLIGGRNGGGNQGNWQTGIAYGADLRSGAIASSWSGTRYATNFNATDNSLMTPFNAFFGTADVINSSWGFTDAPGAAQDTIRLDGLAYNNPGTTFVVSAGNSGPGTNTVGAPGAGYNAITVGALGGANTYDTIANFSSRAPQSWANGSGGTVAGVRAAVDIVAPGATLTSAYYGGQTGGNNTTLGGSPGDAGGPNFYSGGLGGTSFSAPIVAGGATLLVSASRNTLALAANDQSRDARVIKAVLLNSADKLPGWNNGQSAHVNGFGGVQTTQALDYTFGAGRMNLDRAYDQYLAGTTDVAGTGAGNLGFVQEVGWDFGNVQTGLANDYFISTPLSGGSLFNVTLDWFRRRDVDPISFDESDDAQANLNLTVFDATGGVFGNIISQSTSTYNVVEHLSFTLPTSGYYGLRISLDNFLFDNIGGLNSEEYGLAWFGVEDENFVAISALPEPGTSLLLCVGLLWGRRLRRHSRC